MKKRYLVVLLVLVLAVASLPVFAAGTGTLTIENATIGKTYSAYRIFDVTQSEDAYAYTIAKNSQWYQEITNDPNPPFQLEEIETSTGKYNVSIEDENRVLNWLQDKAAEIENKSLAINADAKQTATGTRVEFTGLDYGYYFITSGLGSIITISNFSKNIQIIDKNQEPSLISKEVSHSCKQDSWADSCSAGIGEKINFRIKAFVPKYHQDKRVYRYTFTDEMDTGLTYDADSIVLKIGGVPLNKNDDYLIDISEQIMTIIIQPYAYIEYPADANVEITYSATVNETAIHKNTNSVSMTWTEFDPEADPNDPDNLITPDTENLPPTALATTYVYGFNLHKYKEEALSGNTLDGAEFRLYTAESNGEEIKGEEIKLVKIAEKQYRKALKSETGEIILAGEAQIFGLDTGTYWLEETRAPDGYNQLTARVPVEISEENTTEGYLLNEVQIINKAGITLPTTGGVGTHIFYLAGSLLVLAAFLLLIKKTKQSSSKNDRRI